MSTVDSIVTASVAQEIRAVKMLLILQALALGCQQKHIAAALGVSDATLSRMFPKGFAKEVVKVAARRNTESENR
jgi:DNA-binding transcriptional regulator LsrR (DeoR family)